MQTKLEKASALKKLKGTKIRISSGKETITGKAYGIDSEGNLLVKVRNGRFKKVHSGEIIVL